MPRYLLPLLLVVFVADLLLIAWSLFTQTPPNWLPG